MFVPVVILTTSPVAPYVGAWIEMTISGVSIAAHMSLPMWERGLKSIVLRQADPFLMSLPMWERGLKLDFLC